MKFVRIPGLPGKVYQPPGTAAGQGKHSCPDCFACQHCDDARCKICGPPDEEPPPKGKAKKLHRQRFPPIESDASVQKPSAPASILLFMRFSR
jgi:hypothetical protein